MMGEFIETVIRLLLFFLVISAVLSLCSLGPFGELQGAMSQPKTQIPYETTQEYHNWVEENGV